MDGSRLLEGGVSEAANAGGQFAIDRRTMHASYCQAQSVALTALLPVLAGDGQVSALQHNSQPPSGLKGSVHGGQRIHGYLTGFISLSGLYTHSGHAWELTRASARAQASTGKR